jgi:AcrR family transcriptional regulator
MSRSSEATRLSIINTAGVLFAKYGIDEIDTRAATTTRAIAKAANENTGSIHYHFGGREELLNAVIDYALEPWRNDPLGRHLEENAQLFETEAGQEELVNSLVDLLVKMVYAEDYPPWCGAFLFQVTQKKFKISKKAFDVCGTPLTRAFSTLYKKATGDEDPGNAHAWAFTAFTPLVFHALTADAVKNFFEGGVLPGKYLDALTAFAKAGALAGLRAARGKRTEGAEK